MSHIRTHGRLLLVAVCCIALGAGVSAIATAGATAGHSAHPGFAARGGMRAFAARHGGMRAFAMRHGGMRGFGARAVHGTIVVHTRTGFATVTFDRGTIDAVHGQQLTVTDGTLHANYQPPVTLTIPTTARIRDNGQRASLSQLRPGQRVMVVQAPKHTFVIAHTHP